MADRRPCGPGLLRARQRAGAAGHRRCGGGRGGETQLRRRPRMNSTHVALTVNKRPVTVDVATDRTLLSVLRDELELTGTKDGCGMGICGACSVLVNGQLVSSCLVLAATI